MAGRSCMGIYCSDNSTIPVTKTGMVLWLDATDATSMQQSDTSVTRWKDRSGLNNHAVMQTLSQAPTISTNAIGSATALMFKNQSLELTNKQCMAGIDGVTFMVVFRLGSLIPLAMPFGNVGVNLDSESVEWGDALNWETVTYANIGSAARVQVGTNTALGLASNKTHLLCIAGDSTDGTRMYMNGTQVATWTYGANYRDYLWAVGRTHGKGYGTLNWYFEGAIGEIRIYDHRLLTDDLNTETTGMKLKWGIS